MALVIASLGVGSSLGDIWEPVTVGPNIRVNDPLGPNGAADQPACCMADPPCDDPACCAGRPDCDDDPKRHNEPSIAVAPWDPDLLIAGFNDYSPVYVLGGFLQSSAAIGMALSVDGGLSWERRDRALTPDPCFPCAVDPPPLDCFVRGHAFARVDFCNVVEQAVSGDPGTAIGYGGYLYWCANGLSPSPFFARVQLDVNGLVPISAWEGSFLEVPPDFIARDKPAVLADAAQPNVYLLWTGAFDPIAPLDEGTAVSSNFLSASFDAGASFSPPVQVAHRPSLVAAACGLGGCLWGVAAAVGPDGRVHIVWNQKAGANPAAPPTPIINQIDQLRYRSLVADAATGTLTFDPPIPAPGVTQCAADESDCERGIVFDQPGYNEGFRRTGEHLMARSLNLDRIPTHPSIAVDPNNPQDPCGRGGFLYVAYGAEENPARDNPGVSNAPSSCQAADLDRVIDANVYVVHSRDGGESWSAPVPILPPQVPAQVCTDIQPGFAPCGRHYDHEFFPWIAVDKQGRVGVIYYSNAADTDRCEEKHFKYDVMFAYSLDGGVTWKSGVKINSVTSNTQSDPENEILLPFLGDYAGITAATHPATGHALFHPIWTDLREWYGGDAGVTEGDIYTAQVIVRELVIPIGDYDRDGDVDKKDLAAIPGCSTPGSALPPACEILDCDRNGVVNKFDTTCLMTKCFTGAGTATVQEPGGESQSAAMGSPVESDGELDILLPWLMLEMPAPERQELAEQIRLAGLQLDSFDQTWLVALADALESTPAP